MIDFNNLNFGQLIKDTVVFSKEDIALAEAIGEGIKYVHEKIKLIKYNDTIPDFLLDHKATEEHVDFYDSSFNEDIKRALIDSSPYLHEKKGSYIAIKKVLEIVGMKAEILRWFEYDGEPHHFQIETLHGDFLKRGSRKLAELIEAYKNESSVFDGVTILLMDALLRHIEETYHYFVHFLECGEFWGESIFSHIDANLLCFKDETYKYDVFFDTPHTIHVHERNTITHQSDETYKYDVAFHECGVLALPNATLNNVQKHSLLTSSIYEYAAPFKTCGDFFAEGEVIG